MNWSSRIVRRAPAWAWIPAAAVPLLVVLGMLQFRWLGELSERDRESRQTRLSADAARFSEDFDRELTRAYVAFQLDGEAVERRDGRDAADRYRLWTTQTRHPRLVRDIWIAEFAPASSQDQAATELQRRTVQLAHTGRPVVTPSLGAQSAPSGGSVRLPADASQVQAFAPRAVAGQASWQFLRLDADKLALTEQTLPPELGALRRRLSLSITSPSVGDEPQQHNLYLNPIDEETLSILAPIAMQIPVVTLPLAASDAGTTFVGTFHQPSPALRFVIIQLDRRYIADELLPALSRQYFADPIGSGQLECRVSVVRARAPRTLIYASHPGSQDVTAAADATAPLLGVRTGNMIQQVAVPNGRVDQGAVTDDSGSGHWQLRVTHLAGSLQVLAERTRRQNLLAGSSILALLAGSLALLLVALRRARALTRQQLEFVAGVSHELRTPVAVVCATGANLADGVVSDPEQVRRYGRLIRREGRRLMEMTEQVLSFARIESTSPPLLESTAVETLVRRAVESMQPQIDDAECDCVVALQDSLPPLLVDRASIERAIQNLISNALKYNSERREIRITAGMQTLRAGSRVWIAVEDRGIGIHADELSLIFEPFRRGRAAIERNLRGTGLGLSLVRRIMQAHGGEVRVRSELDIGSTFTLYLPVPQSPAAAAS